MNISDDSVLSGLGPDGYHPPTPGTTEATELEREGERERERILAQMHKAER